MIQNITLLVFVVLFASIHPLLAQVPQLISYQGRVVADGTNFHGSGRFKFALVDGAGAQTFWSNDGSGTGGAEPASAVTAPVNQGLVALFLGDAGLGMQPISSAIFATNADVRLRIWFGDGAGPFQPLSPDQRIVSVGYAMLAASVPDGSISDRHLSPNAAISASKIGGGDLMATRLKVGVSNALNGSLSTIAGGSNNAATADGGAISGGQNNRVTDNFGVVAGGANNQAGNGDSNTNNAPFATVGGGQQNAATEDYATVAGGWTNTASGFASAVGGGRENTASGSYATVPGGQKNRATGNNSFAAGTRAQANHRGAFVWADSTDADFVSGVSDVFLIRATNGVGINTAVPGATLDVSGSGRIAQQLLVEGRLGVRTNNPSADLDVNGSARLASLRLTGPAQFDTNVNVDGTLMVNGAVIAENGAIKSNAISPNSIGAVQLSPGAALANLQASGQSGVASGGLILSEQLNATNLLAAGYARLGRLPVADLWREKASAGAPEPRDRHTVVWTGSEMIIWGGYRGGNLNTGGRYNPALDRWLSTSTATAPSPRQSHTAIWTGTEMVVWGGDGYLNTGGRYNPATDTWRPVATAGAPTGRDFHSAIWTGQEMIIWGGRDGSVSTDTGGRYNPSTDSWAPLSTSGAPAGRNQHTAIWTGTEMVVWGGVGAAYYNSGGRYNPANNTWRSTSAASAPDPRNLHTAIWTGQEMIVWGDERIANTGGRYDPAADSWRATATSGAPSARKTFSAVWTGSEMIVWGGYNGSQLGTGGGYNPETDSWSIMTLVGAPAARNAHSAVWTGEEMVVFGGSGSVYYNDTFSYFPARNLYLYQKP